MKKALIAYFSQGGTTRSVSEQILKGLIILLGICSAVIYSLRTILIKMNWKLQITLGEKLQPIFLTTIIQSLTWIPDLESSIPLKT